MPIKHLNEVCLFAFKVSKDIEKNNKKKFFVFDNYILIKKKFVYYTKHIIS